MDENINRVLPCISMIEGAEKFLMVRGDSICDVKELQRHEETLNYP